MEKGLKELQQENNDLRLVLGSLTSRFAVLYDQMTEASKALIKVSFENSKLTNANKELVSKIREVSAELRQTRGMSLSTAIGDAKKKVLFEYYHVEYLKLKNENESLRKGKEAWQSFDEKYVRKGRKMDFFEQAKEAGFGGELFDPNESDFSIAAGIGMKGMEYMERLKNVTGLSEMELKFAGTFPSEEQIRETMDEIEKLSKGE